MIKIIVVHIFLWTILTINAIAQSQTKPVECRLLNGETGLRDYLKKNTVYPENSIITNSIGFSLASITINPAGAIENITILNPIDQFIDKEVKRVLRSTAALWKKCDTINKSQTFYIQIAFIISTMGSDLMVLSPVKSGFFVDPVVISVNKISPLNSIMTQTNELLAVKCSILCSCKRFDEALIFIDELIRRDPFNKELYQFRIFIYRNMGLKDMIDKDLNRITDFAEGLSLDEIISRNK